MTAFGKVERQILAGKVDLIVFIGSLPYRPAATLRSIFSFCRESLST
jgi:hypothetical protein